MHYDQYELTPLFSYEQSRTAIRHIKEEDNRQARLYNQQNTPSQTKPAASLLIQFGSMGVLVGGIIVAALVF